MTNTDNRAGRIVTFYSYKGGTGRSMMLANTTWLLASAGHDVLMVDWDLEAPGLHRYMAPFLTDPQMTDSNGLIDLVVAYAADAVGLQSKETPASAEWYRSKADVLEYAVSINWKYQSGGTLSLLSAGRQGGAYATKVNTFSWQNFYERLGGHAFFEALKASMRANFDFILVDSRTGVSDTAGICTVQFPDALVVCFTLNNQSIEGAAAVARSVQKQKGQEFRIYPVPTRLDNSESDKLLDRWKLAKERFAELLPTGYSASYWDDVANLYVPKFAYEEMLAPFANRFDDPANLNLLTHSCRLVAATFGVQVTPEVIDDEVRSNVLDHFAGRAAALSPEEARKYADEKKQKEQEEFARAVRQAQDETRLAEQQQRSAAVEQARAQAKQEAAVELNAAVRRKSWQWAALAAAVLIAVVSLFAITDYRRRQQTEAAEAAVRAGDEALNLNRGEEAIKAYTQAIADGQASAIVYAKRATALAKVGRTVDALRDWDKAVTLAPGDGKILQARAQTRLATGDSKGAVADLKELLQREPENLTVVELLARAHERDGQFAEAIPLYSQLLEKTTDLEARQRYLVSRADLHKKAGDKAKAIDDFRRIAKEFANTPTADYAVTQLKDLGVTPSPTPAKVAVAPVVFIQYMDAADETLAQSLRDVVQSQGIKVPTIQIKTGPRRGEIRYFHADDLTSAAKVKGIVERELAKRRSLVSLPIRPFDGLKLNARPGLIEVWLPDLKTVNERPVASLPSFDPEQRAPQQFLIPKR